MPESEGRLPAPTLGTIVVLVTLFAGLAGTWAIMGERIAGQIEAAKDLRARIKAVEDGLAAAEKETALLQYQLKDLREALSDCRQRP